MPRSEVAQAIPEPPEVVCPGKRSQASYTIRNPVLAGNSVMFNDMLGSTLAVDGKRIDMTAFGDSDVPAEMFTGKPQVEELGHVFRLI